MHSPAVTVYSHGYAQPWKIVHVNFVSPFQGAMLYVDAHSKWPEVHIIKETTAAKTIGVL